MTCGRPAKDTSFNKQHKLDGLIICNDVNYLFFQPPKFKKIMGCKEPIKYFI